MSWFGRQKKPKKETLVERYERIKREIEQAFDPSSSTQSSGGHTSTKQKEQQDAIMGFEVDQTTVNLYGLLNPMLFVGNLIYSFAYLRKIARNEELQQEDLIMAAAGDNGSRGISTQKKKKHRQRNFQGRLEKSKITAQEVLQFVLANIDRLNEDEEINSDLSVYALLSLSKLNDAYIANFDDHFAETSLVYGTTVNRDMKRITVVFRGTVTETNNWEHNKKVKFSKMETPKKLIDLGFKSDKPIQVHTGFKTYVFHKRYDPSNPNRDGKQKYNEVKQDILDLYTKDGCEGYDLCITGHSLGGALSTLVAFELAASRKLEPHLNGKSIINVSFASPYVGDEVFNKAFQVLEKAGKVKHIRVSNQHDLVAVSPPLSNYTHVGLNLHLNPSASNGYELSYRGVRSMWGQWSTSPLTRHSLIDYWDRKKKIKNHIGNKTLGDLYEDYVLNNATNFRTTRRGSF